MLCQINPLFWLIESLYWWYFDNAKQLFNNHFLKTNDMKKLFSVFFGAKKVFNIEGIYRVVWIHSK